MNTFKTKAGTELPLINLKGKDYLQVAHRLVWFREEHPAWSIQTEIVRLDEKVAVFKALITDHAGLILATSHKAEHQGHFSDYMEKAETGAIGRALALIGYGTQFAPDLNEEDRIVDSPQIRKKVAAPRDYLSRDDLNRRLMAIHQPYLKKFPTASFPEKLTALYGVKETRELALPQLKDFVAKIEKELGT